MTWGRVRFESSGKTPGGGDTEKPICNDLGHVILDGGNSMCKGPEAEHLVV